MMVPQFTGKHHAWIVLVVALFGIVYACSLTFAYIDPDDAVSIEYHILGRNDVVQPPFERFQLGMDNLLSLLPAREPILRVWAMITTSLAALVFVVLILLLTFACADVHSPWLKSIVALVLLLAAPEFLYLGLLYTPMLVGMCCAVGGHLLLRKTLREEALPGYDTPWKNRGILLSGGLLGLGGVFRWDILAYGAIIALDIMLNHQSMYRDHPATLPRRFRLVMTVGVAAFIVWLGMELVTNDFSKAIPEMLAAAEETREETQVGDIRVFGALAMFFSPAFLVAAFVGAFHMVLRPGPNRWCVLFLALFAALWPFWSTTKEILVLVPAFAMLFTQGFVRLWHQGSRTTGSHLTRVLFAAVLLLPWVLGLRMTYGDSGWGPGFEVAPFTHPVNEGIRNLDIVADAGAAFPTNEGVRPLFGHAYVLLGGEWRDHANSHYEEIQRALKVAINQSMSVLVGMHYDAFVMNNAVRMGFMTNDPERRGFEVRPVVRRLSDATGGELMLFRQPLGALVRDSTNVLQILRATGEDRVVCWSEPGQMRFLYDFAPEALRELGPRTAILDIRRLLDTVRTQTSK